MTSNKYATLRATIARAKRHDCQKVVMRVTLAEELLDQLSNAQKQIAELEAREVKLPKRSVAEVMHMSGFSRDYAEGWCSGNDKAIHGLHAAGVKNTAGTSKGE
ncbi:TPA: hypothetical protein ACG0A1_004399 [Enterobacter ludwigii]